MTEAEKVLVEKMKAILRTEYFRLKNDGEDRQAYAIADFGLRSMDETILRIAKKLKES